MQVVDYPRWRLVLQVTEKWLLIYRIVSVRQHACSVYPVEGQLSDVYRCPIQLIILFYLGGVPLLMSII